MARSIEDYEEHLRSMQSQGRQNRQANRSTARAFAAAVSAFAISALVITTSSDALDDTGTVAEIVFEGGTIALTDDDANRPLFDLDNMGPNRPTTECILITYDGTMVPVDLTMVASATGGLAPYLQLTVDAGTDGRFADCVAFERRETVFEGTLAELVEAEPLELGRFHNQGDDMSFRFRFEMADEQGAVGQLSTVDFAWEVTPP